MQKIIKYPFYLSLLAILFLTSCSKTNEEGRYIPEEAGFVIHLNGASLSSKLPWEEIRQSELIKEAFGDTTIPALAKSVMENPDNTGIDIKKDLLVFMVKDSAGSYVAVEGTVKDDATFKKFLREVGKKEAVESEKNGISFSSTDEMTAAWSKGKFVLLSAANIDKNSNRFRDMYDSSVTDKPEIKRDMVPIAEGIFNLKENKSLGKEEKFTELMKTKGDIHFWVNVEALNEGNATMPGMAALSMINFNKLYKESRFTATVNFENGKINADFKSYSGKEMTEIIKKYSGDKINAEMLKSIPSKNMAVFFALNFKPEGLREYIKLLGVEGFLNMGSAMVGFNLDDFIKANKGDILFALTDLAQDSSGRPEFNAIFSASIGDKPSFNKLIAAANKFGKDKLSDSRGPSIFYNLNEKYFALGNKQQYVDAYLKGNANTGFDFFDKLSGTSGGAYVNFQYILKAMDSQAGRDSLDQVIYDASLKMWDNLTATGGGFQSGGSLQHIEINLVDKSTNSLKQLNNYISTIGMAQKRKEARFRTEYNDETTVQPGVEPTEIPQ